MCGRKLRSDVIKKAHVARSLSQHLLITSDTQHMIQLSYDLFGAKGRSARARKDRSLFKR